MQLFINLNPNYIVVTSVIVQYKRSIKFYNGTMRRETRRARELNPVFMSPECVVIFFMECHLDIFKTYRILKTHDSNKKSYYNQSI